jgi:hypothetical protein
MSSKLARFHGFDLAEWLERLTANAKVPTVLGSIPASLDTVESKGWQMKRVEYLKNAKRCTFKTVYFKLLLKLLLYSVKISWHVPLDFLCFSTRLLFFWQKCWRYRSIFICPYILQNLCTYTVAAFSQSLPPSPPPQLKNYKFFSRDCLNPQAYMPV